MPRAFDRQQPQQDHSPLANLLDFSNIDQTAELAGDMIKSYLDSLLDGVLNVIEDLTGLDLTALGEALKDIDFSSPEAFFSSLALALVEFSNVLLGPNSPINAENLYNQINSSLLGLLPVSQIGVSNPNLLANPGFDTAESLVDNPGWTWDGTDGHSHNGCARTTANGTLRSIVSNVIEVAQNQSLPIGAWVKYSGLAATPGGHALRVNVLAYLGTALVATTQLASLASPTGTSSAPLDNGFVHLSGNYTVPAGVDNIVVQLQVTAAATAGIVKYDDAHASKTGLLAQNLVTNLPTDLANLLTGINARIVEIQALTNSVAGKAGAVLADINTRLNGLTTTGLFDSTKLWGVVPIAGIPTDQLSINNIADLQSLTDNITSYVFGSGTNTLIDDARNALNTHWSTTQSAMSRLDELSQQAQGAASSGTSVVTNFDNFANSAQMPAGWVTTYSGSGTSTLGVKDGETSWYLVNNGGRTAVTHHPTPTNTDFQIVSCTVSIGPDSNAESWVLARVNEANDTYIFVRVVPSGFLKWSAELGCIVNNVKTVWVPLKALPSAADSRLIAGVGSNPRAYQFFVGGSQVFNYTEIGSVSALSAAHRFHGIRGTTNGSAKPSNATVISVADNALPTNVGSTCKLARNTTAKYTWPKNTTTPLGNNFWNTVVRQTSDYTVDLVTGAITVSIEGLYFISVRMDSEGMNRMNTMIVLFKNGVLEANGDRIFFVDSDPDPGCDTSTSGRWQVYLKPGDVLRIGTHIPNVGIGVDLPITVSAANTTDCTWEVGLMNKSLA